jgi:hypothetical protein
MLEMGQRLVRVISLFLATASSVAWAQTSQGFKYNNLSVSPFVNVEYAYDSNVNYSKHAVDDTILRINPGVDLTYKGNDWGMTASGWYAYDDYADNDLLDANRYGERAQFYWETPKGWRVVLGESYVRSDQSDSLTEGGNGLWRNRDQYTVNGTVSYQASEKLGISLSGMYSDLNYDRDQQQYLPLYGWEEWSTGLEFAYRITEKSNILLDGGYQGYSSDGAANGTSKESTGYSLMAGLGSAATKKITYRVLSGLSMFDYADGDQLYGWTYSVDTSWIINRKWALTFVGASYFQPSEREQDQAVQVYALSSGATYRMTRKVTSRLDLGYRREENQYNVDSDNKAKEDRFEARVRTDYQLMRYVTLYAALEYYKELSTESEYEFNRYRATLGVNLRY